MTCPTCGGSTYRTISPGYVECTSDVCDDFFTEELDSNLPLGDDAYGTRTVRQQRSRPCGWRYQIGSASQNPSPTCHCGMFAIGVCQRCHSAVCGDHARSGESLRCLPCHDAERPDREARAAAQERAAAIDPIQDYVASGNAFDFEKFLNQLHHVIEYRVTYSAEDCRRMATIVREALTRDPAGAGAWREFVARRQQWAEQSEVTLDAVRRHTARRTRRLDVSPRPGITLYADHELRRQIESTAEQQQVRSVVEQIQAHLDPSISTGTAPPPVAAPASVVPRERFRSYVLAPAATALRDAGVPYNVRIVGGELKVRKKLFGGWETTYSRGVVAHGWRFDDSLTFGTSGRSESRVLNDAYGYILTPSAELFQYDFTTDNAGHNSGDGSRGSLLVFWARPTGRSGLGPAVGLDGDDVRSDVADGISRMLCGHGVSTEQGG